MNHLSQEQLVAYRRGTTAPVELLQLDDHLEGCGECRDRLAQIAPVEELIAWSRGLEREVSESILPKIVEMPARRVAHRKTALWIGAAAAAAVILGVAGWQILSRGSHQSPPVEHSRTAAPEQIATLIRDGSASIRQRADGSLMIPEVIPQGDRAAVEQAVREGTLTLGATPRDLTTAQGILRGAAAERTFAPLAPLGVVVLSETPEFHWQPLERAQSYQIEIFDANFGEVASSGTLKATTWTPERPLPRGRLYQWQVTAVRDGESVRAPVPPAAEARFRVADAETASRITAAQPSHLAVAILCARAGLRDDARRELEQLSAENPDSAVVKKLLASLK